MDHIKSENKAKKFHRLHSNPKSDQNNFKTGGNLFQFAVDLWVFTLLPRAPALRGVPLPHLGQHRRVGAGVRVDAADPHLGRDHGLQAAGGHVEGKTDHVHEVHSRVGSFGRQSQE